MLLQECKQSKHKLGGVSDPETSLIHLWLVHYYLGPWINEHRCAEWSVERPPCSVVSHFLNLVR